MDNDSSIAASEVTSCPKCGSPRNDRQNLICGNYVRPDGSTYRTDVCDHVAALRAARDDWEQRASIMANRVEEAEATLERMRPLVDAVVSYDEHFEDTPDGGYDIKTDALLDDVREDFDRIWKASATYRAASSEQETNE